MPALHIRQQEHYLAFNKPSIHNKQRALTWKMKEEMPATTPRLEYLAPSKALSRGTPRMTAGRFKAEHNGRRVVGRSESGTVERWQGGERQGWGGHAAARLPLPTPSQKLPYSHSPPHNTFETANVSLQNTPVEIQVVDSQLAVTSPSDWRSRPPNTTAQATSMIARIICTSSLHGKQDAIGVKRGRLAVQWGTRWQQQGARAAARDCKTHARHTQAHTGSPGRRPQSARCFRRTSQT